MHDAYWGIHIMAQSVIHLTQSRFYSPAFNAAVFDGPIRIYFAQHQEALALKVYFKLQQYLQETYSVFRNSFKQHGQTIFLMLYPTLESFENSFSEEHCNQVVAERLGDDHVVGVRGPLDENEYEVVFKQVQVILQDLRLTPEFAAPSA
ncbi:MAG: hypothetical protein KF799_10915 [Bdellovibrionales bacterium]|nr:hypothetical protein [Bdellovibrionales bacterium]